MHPLRVLQLACSQLQYQMPTALFVSTPLDLYALHSMKNSATPLSVSLPQKPQYPSKRSGFELHPRERESMMTNHACLQQPLSRYQKVNAYKELLV